MTDTIIFRWNTGKIELAACAVLDMTAAQLSKLVKTATANAEEVKNQISDYISAEIENLNPKSEYDKKMIAQYKKLLSAAVGERKQTAQEKAIARIIKNCSRAQFTGVFENAGKYCILDGYRMVRYSTPLENFPKAPDSLDTEKVIGDKSRYNIRLNLPTVKQLKADIKLAKMGNMDIGRIHVDGAGRSMIFRYDFGYGLPLVDPMYLIDMLDALPNAAAYAIDKSSGIYFTDGENDGLLLPCHKTQEYEEPAPVAEAAPVEIVEEKPVDQAAPVVDETVDIAAINRVVAVAIAVCDGAHNLEAIVDYVKMYGEDMITEDEAKNALLHYTVPLALPAHVDAPQAAETVDAVQSVVAVHPAVLRNPGRFKKLSAKADIEPSRGHKPSIETRLCMMNNAFCLNSS